MCDSHICVRIETQALGRKRAYRSILCPVDERQSDWFGTKCRQIAFAFRCFHPIFHTDRTLWPGENPIYATLKRQKDSIGIDGSLYLLPTPRQNDNAMNFWRLATTTVVTAAMAVAAPSVRTHISTKKKEKQNTKLCLIARSRGRREAEMVCPYSAVCQYNVAITITITNTKRGRLIRVINLSLRTQTIIIINFCADECELLVNNFSVGFSFHSFCAALSLRS